MTPNWEMSTTMGTLAVRPTREPDAAKLRELRLEALWMHPEAFGSDHATSSQRPMNWWVERAVAGTGDGDQVTYVAQAAETGELVGMSGVYREDGLKVQHNGHVWGVYVRPAWRGLGVADALLDACETWARSRGIRVLRLAVVTTNEAAIKCYQRRAFTAFGTAPAAICHNGTYFDELLMCKHLADGPAT